MCSDAKTIRIGGEDKSPETVKSVFMKLKYDHIAHVIYLLDNNDAEIHNMKGYMLTLLYSSVFTIDSYYKANATRFRPMIGIVRRMPRYGERILPTP